MKVGDTVRVLPPFAHSFPGAHTITEALLVGDVQVYVLGDAGAFIDLYLEVVA